MPSAAPQTIIDSARRAFALGYTPVPIRDGQKRPALPSWSKLEYASEADVERVFRETADVGGLGLLLGEPSGGLIDIDLDHPKARRAADHILLPTPMQSGRASSRWSHRWYRVSEGDLPATRRYKLPDGSTTVELRANGAQTVVPPSPHPSGETYRWEGGTEWAEPAAYPGHVIAARAATLALITVLLDEWPERGGRHDAYLALAGGLLRTPDGLHPLWEHAVGGIIGTIAELTDDEDGADQRVGEVVPSTINRLVGGRSAQGWPTLARIIGDPHTQAAIELVREIEYLLGFGARATERPEPPVVTGPDPDPEGAPSTDPLDSRTSSWASVDLGPYIRGEVPKPAPTIFLREDGQGLLYPGRVNLFYSKRESGKSWVSLLVVKERLAAGENVMLIDLEDEPTTAVARLMALGTPEKQIGEHLAYIRPEAALSSMLPNEGAVVRQEDEDLAQELSSWDPGLIVVDGMTVLYSLHGLDTNHSVETEVIGGWLKRLTRNGRSTVLLIDHVAKSATRASDPIGSQHKMAMVQGAAYHVWNVHPIVPGQKGRTELIVGKDRHGAVRAVATPEDPQVAASLLFDSSPDGETMQVTVEVPKASLSVGDTPEVERGLANLLRAQDNLLAAIAESDGGLTTKELRLAAAVKAETADQALKVLVDSGQVVVEKRGNARVHRIAEPSE